MSASTEVAIADWLRGAALRDANRIYLDDKGQEVALTFAQVDERVDRLANVLRAVGINPGDRLAIVATDSHRYIETVWASMRLGAIFVPLNVRLSAAELAELLVLATPAVVFVSAAYAEIVDGVTDGPRVINYDTDYEAMLGVADAECVRVIVGDAAPLGLAFTSGTTGAPKAVIQSQRMIKSIVMDCVLCWETRPDEVYYSGAPLFHISGMAMVLMGALMQYTSVLAPQFDASAVARWLARDELTSLFVVPSMLSSVLAQPSVVSGPCCRLRAIHYGAAPMPVPLLRRAFEVFRCAFVQAFGAGTESGWNTVLSSADHRRALAGADHLLHSVGRPAPGVELRICDDAWNDVDDGDVGEIVVRSDMVMSGYLDRTEESALALHPDGWFRAGDLGRRDAEGYVYVVDRKKDMVIRGGENIYPAEVERVLYEHPGVCECAVIGIPDPHWGQVLQAHLVFADPGVQQPTPEALEGFCRSRLAAFKVPRRWVFCDQLPRNASGKILKRSLR